MRDLLRTTQSVEALAYLAEAIAASRKPWGLLDTLGLGVIDVGSRGDSR